MAATRHLRINVTVNDHADPRLLDVRETLVPCQGLIFGLVRWQTRTKPYPGLFMTSVARAVFDRGGDSARRGPLPSV